MKHLTCAVIAAALLMGGCKEPEPTAPLPSGDAKRATPSIASPAPTTPAPAKPESPPAARLPATEPPSPAAEPSARAAAEQPAQPAGPPPAPGKRRAKMPSLLMDVPETWDQRDLSGATTMRLGSFTWPLATGDSGMKPDLAVFFFPTGQGGSNEANLERWRGQFKEPAKQEGDSVENFKAAMGDVVLLDKTGDYYYSPTPMSTQNELKENWRMLAALIETPGGRICLRAIGPAASVTAERDAFLDAIRTLQSGPR